MRMESIAAPESGVIGEVQWGTHLCQLYDSSQDLIELLVPFFRKGLEKNALCLWLACMPLRQQVMEALRKGIPQFDQYQQKGQIQGISHTEWYLSEGRLSASRSLEHAAGALSQARLRGFAGVWVAGDLSWLDKAEWPTAASYEDGIPSLISDVPAVALCAYPIRGLETPEALDLFRSHRSILVKREGRWEIVESLGQARAEKALRESERSYKRLFETSLNGVQVIDAATGRVLVANPAVARIFGFASPEDMVGVDPLDYVAVNERERIAQLLSEALFERELDEAVQMRAVKVDGSQVWISATGVRTEYQGRLALLVSIRDITQQRDAENALQESQRQLQSVFDGVQDGIVVLDMQGRLTAVNRRVLEVGGYSAEDLLGKTFDRLPMFAPQDVEKMVNAFAPVLAGNNAPLLEVKVKTKSGVDLILEIRTSPLKKDGQVLGSIAVLRDVTERRRAVKFLEVSEQRNRLLVENANEGIVVLQNDHLQFANRKTLEIMGSLGYTVEELKARPLEAFVFPEDRQMFRETSERLRACKDLHGLHHFRAIGKAGQIRWIELNAVGLPWDGKPAVLVFLDDVTSRKHAENALIESEKRYRLLAENVSDVIWVTDLDLRPTYISPSIKGLVGYEVNESLLGRLDDALAPSSAKRVREVMQELLSSGRNRIDNHPLELEVLRGDGTTVWVDTTMSVIRDQRGRPIEFLGVLRNITQRKRAEEELQKSFERLEKTLAGTIQAIRAMVDTRDRYTAGHQQRVTELACAIAEAMGLTREQVQAVHVAGQLHDVGKITLPTEILTKPGRLNEIEFAMIRTHPKAGFDILESIDFPWPIAQMVLQHHERINGSGYPAGVRGDDILIEARIIAVADVVEAMSSHRPYRPALGLEKALDEIEHNREVLYDPVVSDACMSVFRDRGFTFKYEAAAG